MRALKYRPSAALDGAPTCLNCGEALAGPFCSACGQRAVPPHPTTAELAGDAWQELSGYDGRIAATLRGLLHPGQLTRDYLAGRRAHYLPPLRVYLTVSILYFLVAAAAPSLSSSSNGLSVDAGIHVGFTGASADKILTPEDREQLRQEIGTAPRLLQPMLHAILEDPAGFRTRIFTTMPRVLFAMLPVFAAIVAMFYRGRTFPTSLVFAVHLHAFAFLALTMPELAKFSGLRVAAAGVGMAVAAGLAVYVLKAFRLVYGGSWPSIIGKTVAIGFVYFLSSIPAFIVMLLWVSM